MRASAQAGDMEAARIAYDTIGRLLGAPVDLANLAGNASTPESAALQAPAVVSTATQGRRPKAAKKGGAR